MIRLLLSSQTECINIKSALLETSNPNLAKAGDNRMLFMPHSPGIYIALVLKDAQAIIQEEELSDATS